MFGRYAAGLISVQALHRAPIGRAPVASTARAHRSGTPLAAGALPSPAASGGFFRRLRLLLTEDRRVAYRSRMGYSNC